MHSPATVAQRQLDAYDARDLEALLATYASDAEPFEHPHTLLARGLAALRERFAALFQEPNLHAILLQRMVAGRFVVDHERVTRTFPEAPGELEVLMTYEIVDGKIARSWSLITDKTLA